MYSGYWEINKDYKRGDIIYVCTLAEYYICINDHISDRLTFPNKEDLYWSYISNSFLNFFKTLDELPEPKYNKCKYNESKNDKGLNNLINDVITDSLNDIKKKSPVYLKKSRSYNKEYNEISKLKRKLRMVEDEIINYKRQKYNGDDLMNDLKNKLLCMDLNIETKSFLLDKYESIRGSYSSSDNSKILNWLNTVVKIPYGKYKDMDVK